MKDKIDNAKDEAAEARTGPEAGMAAKTPRDGDAAPAEGGKARVRLPLRFVLLVAASLLVGASVGVISIRFLGEDAAQEGETEESPDDFADLAASPRSDPTKPPPTDASHLMDASSELKVGLGFLRNARYADAVRVLSRYARSDERKTDAERIALYSGLSEGYRGLGQEDRGAIYARKARKLVEESGVSVGLLDLAEKSYQAGDFAEARKLFYRYLCGSGDPEDLENELVSLAFHRIADTYRDEVAVLVAGRDTP